MNIFKVFSQNGFWSINIKSDGLIFDFNQYVREKKKLELNFIKYGKPSDFYMLNASNPAFNKKSYSIAFDILKQFGHFQEIECEGELLYLFFCDNQIDCFDRKSSIFKEDSGNIYLLEKVRFKIDKISNQDVFKVPEMKNIFFTDSIAMKLKKIRGITFINIEDAYDI